MLSESIGMHGHADILKMTMEIINHNGPVVINSGINQHRWSSKPEIVFNLEKNTIEEVYNAVKKMDVYLKRYEESRTYFFEGYSKKLRGNVLTFELLWGS